MEITGELVTQTIKMYIPNIVFLVKGYSFPNLKCIAYLEKHFFFGFSNSEAFSHQTGDNKPLITTKKMEQLNECFS